MPQASGKKVLLIGWDAADWEMIDPLLQSGHMPALAKLIGDGVRGNLATLQPVLSPMLWTSIATGKRADKHGICGFTEPLADGTGIGPVRSTSRRCKTIWNILSQSGMKSNVVGWFASHPAEPINGVMITDQFLRPPVKHLPPHESGAGMVHPADLATAAAALRVGLDDISAADLVPFIPRLAEIDLSRDDHPAKLARRLTRVATVQALATTLIQSEPWNLMCVYYDGIDQFAHEFMPFHPPRMKDVSERDYVLYQHVMSGCYRFHDMMLHTLLQYIDAQTTVILVSDHGYECGQRRPPLDDAKRDPEACHRGFGIACLNGPDIKPAEHLYGASILDVTPTILTLLGLPVGGDMDGRPWLEVLRKPVKPERIFSWEGVGDDKAGLHCSEARQDPAEAAQAIEQLVELGYIAPPGEDVRQTIRETLRYNKTHLVRALIETPRMAQVVPLLRELMAEKPDNEWCVLTLARCQIALRQLPEARALLEATAAETQRSPQVQLLFADLAFAEGNKTQALRHLEAANACDVTHPLLCNQVGRAFLRFEHWPEAAVAFGKSLATEPDNPAALDGLAAVHLAQGEWERAVEKSLKAVGLLHFYPEAHFHLAVGLERTGQTREAIAAYETALGFGYQPAVVHRRLVELYQSFDPQKTRDHRRALSRLRRPPVYRADFKSKLASEPPPGV